MTNAELIAILQQLPQDLPVVGYARDEYEVELVPDDIEVVEASTINRMFGLPEKHILLIPNS